MCAYAREHIHTHTHTQSIMANLSFYIKKSGAEKKACKVCDQYFKAGIVNQRVIGTCPNNQPAALSFSPRSPKAVEAGPSEYFSVYPFPAKYQKPVGVAGDMKIIEAEDALYTRSLALVSPSLPRTRATPMVFADIFCCVPL